MNIDLNKTLEAIRKALAEKEPGIRELKRAYQETLRLQSQILASVYDMEAFGGKTYEKRPAQEQSWGRNDRDVVVLSMQEPLPAMKRLTEAVEEHWKAMIHSAIGEAARRGPLPYFRKAFVEIEITTPKGSDNAKVWDTSNRAINVIINNLKGIFFEDNNMEHMAFSVVGKWGENGVTMIRVSELDESRQIRGNRF